MTEKLLTGTLSLNTTNNQPIGEIDFEIISTAIHSPLPLIQEDGCKYLSLVARKPAFGIFDQVSLKPACAATEAR